MITLILANRPLDVADWRRARSRDNRRKQYGVPPACNSPERFGKTVRSLC